MKKRFQGKQAIRVAIKSAQQSDNMIESVRRYFGMEWGENAYSDLDVALTHVQNKLAEVRDGLDDLLLKYKGKTLRPNFPRKKAVKPSLPMADVQLLLMSQ